jgi:peptide-methionine (R)-S-oxide reductase
MSHTCNLRRSIVWLSFALVIGCQASVDSDSEADADRSVVNSSVEQSTLDSEEPETVTTEPEDHATDSASGSDKVVRSETEWKQRLTPDQYYVLRKHGTERAFTNEYWDNKDDGTYHCRGCGSELFESETKYDSGTGWPSFYQPIDAEAIGTTKDNKLFYVRTEVHCDRCGGHLGHVFEDGPAPTGLRYCINSVSLEFRNGEEDE